MADLTLDKMLEMIRNDAFYRKDTYDRVKGTEKSWYTNDITGNARFLEDTKQNPATVPSVPTGSPAGTLPAGYADAAYAALPAPQRHLMLADLELPHYHKKQKLESAESERKQSFGFWRNAAIAAGAAGALALFGAYTIPSVSVDEAVVQYETQKHEINVQDYMRTHEGRSPPWKKTPDQIHMDNTTKYSAEKSFLFWGGILSLAGGLASGLYSFSKRK